MLTAAIPVLDQIIRLTKERESNHRKLLTDFVDPLYDTFQALHRDYVQTFVGYRRRVRSWTSFRENIDAFCEELREDNYLSDSLRAKLSGEGSEELRPVLRNFVSALTFYIRGRVNEIWYSEGGFWTTQVYRVSVMMHFKNLAADPNNSESELLQMAVDFIDDMLKHLEASARNVEREYAWQRTKLLR